MKAIDYVEKEGIHFLNEVIVICATLNKKHFTLDGKDIPLSEFVEIDRSHSIVTELGGLDSAKAKLLVSSGSEIIMTEMFGNQYTVSYERLKLAIEQYERIGNGAEK